MKKIIVLGCTGSIGRNTMDILRKNPEDFMVTGLQAHSSEKQLLELSETWPDAALCLSGREPEDQRIRYTGDRGILRMIDESEADIVVNGIVGASGLEPAMRTLERGMDLALANKESLVLAGPLIKQTAQTSNCRLLPVDSEHSAVFQLLENREKDSVAEIILTASGGPFRNKPLDEFPQIRKKDALAHPTWEMGPKITVDSATMANKGLEVIEAQQLFDFDIDSIKVLIHPQSYVHSLIRTKDMALYAQISEPDMRLPISDALYYPEIREVPWTYLDLAGKTLEFQKPDYRKFPMLRLAFECARLEKGYPTAYNGANEVAVEAFLKDRISFVQISEVTETILNRNWDRQHSCLEEIHETDALSRQMARDCIGNFAL